MTFPEQWIDRIIRRAREQGEFNELLGRGAPLEWDEENPFEDPAWRTAYRVLREAGLAPPWIEQAREIRARTDTVRESLRAAARTKEAGAWEAARLRAMEAIQVINALVKDLNLAVPVLQLQVRPVELDEELRRAHASTP
jgi:hypothetical protein